MDNILKKYNIKKSDKLIIACSGGCDSMYLLSKIIKVNSTKNIIVAHYNHMLRGNESNRDEDFVINFCKKNNLIIEVGSHDISNYAKEKKIGIEEAARIKRYEFLNEQLIKYNAKFILTAHHLDDSIETFVFNLLRGTKLNGLSGIDEVNGNILRPLLNISKNEILNYCNKNKIKYIEDSSNSNEDYLRNYIRSSIVSKFSEINPNYKKNISDLMQYFSELKGFIDSIINKIIKDDYFLISDFLNLSLFEKKELIANIYKQSNNGTIGLSKGNIDEIIKFIGDKGNKTKKEIKNLKLFKDGDKIYIK